MFKIFVCILYVFILQMNSVIRERQVYSVSLLLDLIQYFTEGVSFAGVLECLSKNNREYLSFSHNFCLCVKMSYFKVDWL